MALDTQSDFTQVALQMSNQEPLAYEGGYGFYGWVSRLEDKKELGILKDEVFGHGAMYSVDTMTEVSNDEMRVTMLDDNQEAMVRLASKALKLRQVLN